MRAPRLLKGIWSTMAGKNQNLEVSEELTNAYFGNQDAWQVHNENTNEETGTAEKDLN